MFTGIIESLSKLIELRHTQTNVTLTFQNPLVAELTVKQSLCHNGICLTIEQIDLSNQTYRLTAVAETLNRTNLRHAKVGDWFNIERCLTLQDRLDGHIVQGHVDGVAICCAKENRAGSYWFTFDLSDQQALLVPKGSIAINGVSLTVAALERKRFSVAIIPYTYAHTNFKTLTVGDEVNLEFDLIGKYVEALYKQHIV